MAAGFSSRKRWRLCGPLNFAPAISCRRSAWGSIRCGEIICAGSVTREIWSHFTACLCSNLRRSCCSSSPTILPAAAKETRPEIIDMFSDRYFPGETRQSSVALPRKELEDIEGVYQSTRREESGKLKLLSLLSQTVATVDKEGVLHIEDIKDLRHHPVKWKAIGKDLWQEKDGQRRVFAIRGQGGGVVRLAYDFPGVQAQRVPWYEHEGPVLAAVGASLGGADTGGSCSPHPRGQEIDSAPPASSGASAGNSSAATDDASGGRPMGGAAGYPWNLRGCAWRRGRYASHIRVG